MKHSIKTLLLGAFITFGSLSGSAVPAKPGMWRMITLADGTQVRVELRGDEHLGYWADANGNAYNLADDGKHYIQIDLANAQTNAQALRARANSDRLKKLNSYRSTRLGQASGPITGKKKGIVILVNFKDKKFSFSHKPSFYENIINGTNYTSSLGFVGSVKDYFLAQSNGQFELDFDIVGPYTLSQNYSYYGKKTQQRNDQYAYKMIEEAVKQADKDVNFADYDWDGNGYVDQVFVLFAGLGQAAGGDDDTIWPHESQLRYYDGSLKTSATTASGDPVYVDTYACGPELTVEATSVGYKSRVDGIGTICHEFSHCLGYPDMYDTNYENHLGMGDWDLMCSGSYNGDSFCPPNFTAYEKAFAGWITPIELNKPTTVKGLAAQDVKYGQAFIIYNDATADEYYILENRQNNVGIWDKALPASGMMITHVDYDSWIWECNSVNTMQNYSNLKNDHERLTIFCADNDRQNTTASEAGDLYPYNGNNELTDTSLPAAIVYNGGTNMGKPITNITQNADGTISFDFMGGSADNVITGVDGVSANAVKADMRVYSIDGRYLGTDINALGHGVFVQGGKKIVK